jgi:hypothetical protein
MGEVYPSSEGFEISILTAKNCTSLEDLLAAIRASCVGYSADPVVAARERQFFTDFFDNDDNGGVSFIRMDDGEQAFDEYFAFSTLYRLSQHWSYEELLQFLPRFFDPLFGTLPIAFIYGSIECNFIHGLVSLDAIGAETVTQHPIWVASPQRAVNIQAPWKKLARSCSLVNDECQSGW